jgi:hypothetical protein
MPDAAFQSPHAQRSTQPSILGICIGHTIILKHFLFRNKVIRIEVDPNQKQASASGYCWVNRSGLAACSLICGCPYSRCQQPDRVIAIRAIVAAPQAISRTRLPSPPFLR